MRNARSIFPRAVCTAVFTATTNGRFGKKGDFFKGAKPRNAITGRIISDCRYLKDKYGDDCPEILSTFLGDAYQPAESTLGLTRMAIRTRIGFNLPFTIFTKSALINRDLEPPILRIRPADWKYIISGLKSAFEAAPDEIDPHFASVPADEDRDGRRVQGGGLLSSFCIEFRDDASDQRLVYPVLRGFAQHGIHLALDLLSFLAVQPIVPIFDRIPGAEHQIFTRAIETP